MAISPATVWEVRPTNGTDTNGGAFVTGAAGTDYSQQNAKNTVGNNISTTDAVAVGTTTITSATGAFTSAIVGNLVYFAGGTGTLTAQWRQVTAFTNITTIVVDLAIAAGTGITMNIGGALKTIGQLNTNLANGHKAYFKAEADMVLSSALAPTLNATAGGDIVQFIGYTTTRTDNGQCTLTTSTNSVDLIRFNTAVGYTFKNFIFSTSAGTPGDGVVAFNGSNSGLILFENCVFSAFHRAIYGDWSVDFSFNQITLINCEIKNCTSHGIANSGVTTIIGCFIHGCTGDGVHVAGGNSPVRGTVSIIFSVIYNNGGSGYLNQLGQNSGLLCFLVAINSAFVSNTGDGVNTNSGTQQSATLINCIFDSNGGWGVNFSNNPSMSAQKNNFYHNNTSGDHRNYPAGSGDVAGSASPFTNPGAGDFTLNGTAGGGAACAAAGWQSTLI